MSWSSAVPAQPGPSVGPHELHYLASIRYPILSLPLPLDRIVALLSKARESANTLTFQWVRLLTPKSGECFVMAKFDDIPVSEDGYCWQPSVERHIKVVNGQNIELWRFCTGESVQPPMVRLEYRIPLSRNKLVFVHYLNAATPGVDAESLLRLPRPQPPPLVRSDGPGPTSVQSPVPLGKPQDGNRPLATPLQSRQVGRLIQEKKVSATKPSARPTVEELPDLLNDNLVDHVDVVDKSMLRMSARQASLAFLHSEMKASSSATVTSPLATADTVVLFLHSHSSSQTLLSQNQVEAELRELEEMRKRRTDERHQAKTTHSSMLQEISGADQLPSWDDALQRWLDHSSLKGLRARCVPSISMTK